MLLGIPLWFLFSLTAAILWGIGYVLDEELLKTNISPAMLMIFQMGLTLPFYFAFVYFYQKETISSELTEIFNSKKLMAYLLIAALCIMGGNLLIMYGIAMKNASLVSLIEISYPFFVILFSYLFFKDLQINIYTGFGGILIFSGIALVYLKS